MKTVKKYAFPVLLLLACGTVWFWQHALASLPYLPNNEVVPLAVMTPLLLVFTFFASFALLKTCGTPRPVLRAVCSTAAMLALVLAAGVFFLSFLTYRFAAPLPVLRLPDWPVGVVMCIVAALCAAHLTGLLLYGLIKKKNAGQALCSGAGRLAPAELLPGPAHGITRTAFLRRRAPQRKRIAILQTKPLPSGAATPRPTSGSVRIYFVFSGS